MNDKWIPISALLMMAAGLSAITIAIGYLAFAGVLGGLVWVALPLMAYLVVLIAIGAHTIWKGP